MFLDPHELQHNPDRLEDIEKASLRLVAQALYDYRSEAIEIFRQESDLVADIGEDITREALDRMGMSKIDQRLFGKMDYKRARYIFHPDYAVRQALFVDSKAEKIEGERTATLQTSQFSLQVRQIRARQAVEVSGTLPPVERIRDELFLTTTCFVKYNYRETVTGNTLTSITLVALPNGFLQEKYNPSVTEGIWLAGRNAPTRGEAFRVRLSLLALQEKCRWRVQKLPLPPEPYVWHE